MTTETPWDVIERHLIAAGKIAPDGTTRRAQPRRCRTCGAATLVGLDDDRCAVRAEVDPVALSALGELLAQLEHRRTYALTKNAGRIVLDYRDGGRIAYRPPGQGRYDVMATHVCWSKTRLPAIASFIARTPRPAPGGAPCPF